MLSVHPNLRRVCLLVLLWLETTKLDEGVLLTYSIGFSLFCGMVLTSCGPAFAKYWLSYSVILSGSVERKCALRYVKTGNKKRATCFATLLQNELNSDVGRFTTHIKPVLQPTNRVVNRFKHGWLTRNMAIELVLQAIFAKQVTRFLLPVFT